MGCPDKFMEKLVGQRKSGQKSTKVTGQKMGNQDLLGSSLGKVNPDQQMTMVVREMFYITLENNEGSEIKISDNQVCGKFQ